MDQRNNQIPNNYLKKKSSQSLINQRNHIIRLKLRSNKEMYWGNNQWKFKQKPYQKLQNHLLHLHHKRQKRKNKRNCSFHCWRKNNKGINKLQPIPIKYLYHKRQIISKHTFFKRNATI